MNPDVMSANAAAVARCRDEQVRAATLLLAGHPEERGLKLAIADWMAEELIHEYPEWWPA